MRNLRSILQRKQVYNSCDEMPMNVFIDIICEKIKEPNNWAKIFEQYQTLIKDNKSVLYLQLLREISYTENKNYLIQTLCLALSERYNKEIATQLHYLFPRFKFENTDKLIDELKRTIASIKSNRLKLGDKKQRLKLMSSNSKPKTSDWVEQFIYLTKFMGVKMTIFNTTVTEYCKAIELIKEANKPIDNGS